MNESMKKLKIKELTTKMLIESHENAIKKIDKILNSGCIDLDNWDIEFSPMLLPKNILTAILEDEATQYHSDKKEVKNIKYFL